MATRPRSAPKAIHSSQKETNTCCTCGGLKVSLKSPQKLSPSHHPPSPHHPSSPPLSFPPPPTCTLHLSWQQLHDTLIDKDFTIQSLNDEICKLNSYERESVRKDAIIGSLREEIASLHKTLADKRIKSVPIEEELVNIKDTLKDKDYEIQQLNNTVTELKERVAQFSRQVGSLQTQLTHKNSQLLSHCDELRALKREKRFTEDNLSTANDSSKEKQTTISSLQERVKRLKTANQDLTTKLQSTQDKYSQLIETEKSLRDEIHELKTKSNQIKHQLSNTQEQLKDNKLTTTHLNEQLSSTKGQLEQMCHQLRGLVSLYTSSKQTPSTDCLLSSISLVVKEQIQLKKGHTQLIEEHQLLQEEHQELTEKYTEIQNGLESIMKCLSSVQPLSPLPGAAITLHSSLQQLSLSSSSLSPILHTLTNLSLTTHTLHNELTTVSSKLQDALKMLHPKKVYADKGTRTLVECILEEIQTSSELKETYEQQIASLSEQHNISLKECEVRVRETCAVEMRREIETAKHQTIQLKDREYSEIMSTLETRGQQEKMRKQEEIELIKTHLQDKERELIIKGQEMESLNKSFNELNTANEELLNELDNLKDTITVQEKEHGNAIMILNAQKDSNENQLTNTLTEYKIQCQEHASTIVSLETKLLSSLQKVETWKEKEQTAQTSLTSLQRELDTLNSTCQSSQNKTQSVIQVLRRQLTHANEASEKERQRAEEKEREMKRLQESCKQEIAQLTTLHQEQLVDLRTQLAQRETTLTELLQTIKETPPTPAPSYSPSSVKDDHTPITNEVPDEKPHSSSDTLVAAGHRCLGDNHLRIIESQRHALHDMRQKMDELLRTHPPVPSHQAALKELAKLRQELVQIKTEEIIREEEEKKKRTGPVPIDISHMTSGRSQQEAELEELLKESEEAYYQILSFLCEKLNIPRLPEFHPLSGATNKVARQHILQERNEFITGTLKESLSALRRRHKPDTTPTITPTTVINNTTPINDTSVIPSPDLSPYGVYSNDVLERLDQEKRLQEAITRRKDFKSQTKQLKTTRRRSHSCLITPDEMQHRIDQVHRSYTQRLDKKSAEISKLKQELQSSQIQSNTITAKMKILKSKSS